MGGATTFLLCSYGDTANHYEHMKHYLPVTLHVLIALCLCFTGRGQDTIPSGTILFHSGQYRIRPSDMRELRRFIAAARIDSPLFVLVEGHSDSVGNYTRNKLLSLKRAMAVKEWLVKQGLGDIIVRAWGPDRPVADNRTREGRRRNRRVDIYFSRPQLVVPITPDREALPDIAELYQQIGTPLQRFCINPYRDTVIRCSQGTVIYIKAGSFVPSVGCDGGCVSFQVREEFLPSDMVMDDLSTTSDGRVLETQGMIYTEAVDCQGKKLDLQKGRDLVVLIPTDTVNAGAKVFKGNREDDSIMNWTMEDSPMLSSFSLPDIVRCGGSLSDATNKATCHPCHFFFCRIGRVVKVIGGVFSKQQRAQNLAFRQCQEELKNPSPAQDPKCPELERLLRKYGVSNTDSLIKAISQPLLDHFKVSTMKQLLDTLEKAGNTVELNAMGRRVPLANFKYYVFNTPQTGWSNIDFLTAIPYSSAVTVKLNVPAQKNISCKLVCRERRTIIPAVRVGGKLEIRGAPNGEKAVIVGIRYENGQPLLALKEIIVNEVSFDLDWKSVSVEELKEALKKLDQ